MQDINKHRILVAPLDWGLGHATRCIPLINQFILQGKDVLLAADGDAYALLNKEFPQLKIIRLKGYRVRYSAIFPLWLKIFLQIPKIIFRIIKEHLQLKQLIRAHQIEMVVSDNRYGLWNKNILSVFVTHQLNIRASVFSPLVNSINHWFIKKYNECWVPDYSGNNNLSGDLSHGINIPSNVKYIGPLSRFEKQDRVEDIDLLCLISGPEPQRSLFEHKLDTITNTISKQKVVMVGGTFKQQQNRRNITYISFAETKVLQDLIARSKLIIARAGYSTIMDLQAMKKKMILVPTPGQTEQEYLASYLSNNADVFKATPSELSTQFICEVISKQQSVKKVFALDNVQ